MLNAQPALEALDSNAHLSSDSYSPQSPSTRERLHDIFAFGEQLTGKMSKANTSGMHKETRLGYFKMGGGGKNKQAKNQKNFLLFLKL